MSVDSRDGGLLSWKVMIPVLLVFVLVFGVNYLFYRLGEVNGYDSAKQDYCSNISESELTFAKQESHWWEELYGNCKWILGEHLKDAACPFESCLHIGDGEIACYNETAPNATANYIINMFGEDK